MGKWLGKAAVLWVMDEAPDMPAHLIATLLVLARHAGTDGKGAYPAASAIAAHIRKSLRQVQRDLAELEELKLIRRGDQRIAAHVPVNKRPVVYDLAMPRYDTHDVSNPGLDTTPVTAGYDTGDALGTSPTSHRRDPEEISNTRARANGASAPRAANRKPRRGTCDRGGPGRRTEACRSGNGAGCFYDWCECRCHAGRRAKAAAP